MQVSILISIGLYPYFVRANLENIRETCGVDLADVDFVFLTHDTVPQNLLDAFEEERRRGYKFRVVRAPFDSGLNQLRLFDWAMANASLREWVVIQHSDLFWLPGCDPWMPKVQKAIQEHPDHIFLTNDFWYNFSIDGKMYPPIVTDSLCVFNRKRFVEQKLFWEWGHPLESQHRISPELSTAIDLDKIARYDSGTFETKVGWTTWLDGGIFATLETALRFPHLINRSRFIEIDTYFHPWQFYRVASSARLKDGVFRIRTETKNNLTPQAAYSYISSFCFDRKDLVNPYPWSLFVRIADRLGYDHRSMYRNLAPLQRYRITSDVLGHDDMGVHTIYYGKQRIENHKLWI